MQVRRQDRFVVSVFYICILVEAGGNLVAPSVWISRDARGRTRDVTYSSLLVRRVIK